MKSLIILVVNLFCRWSLWVNAANVGALKPQLMCGSISSYLFFLSGMGSQPCTHLLRALGPCPASLPAHLQPFLQPSTPLVRAGWLDSSQATRGQHVSNTCKEGQDRTRILWCLQAGHSSSLTCPRLSVPWCISVGDSWAFPTGDPASEHVLAHRLQSLGVSTPLWVRAGGHRKGVSWEGWIPMQESRTHIASKIHSDQKKEKPRKKWKIFYISSTFNSTFSCCLTTTL